MILTLYQNIFIRVLLIYKNVILVNVLNFVKAPKQRTYTKELEERAIEFHGHGGPFMIIGLKMGLHALEMLDVKGWFNLRCTVCLNWAPPDSCVIDGIQSSTGCTMGKHNIEVVSGEGVSAVFAAGDSSIRFSLKDEVLTEIKCVFEQGNGKVNKLMSRLVCSDPAALFHIERKI